MATTAGEAPSPRRRSSAMNHLEKLNPLGKPKIQHPAAAYSHTLSRNVEDRHRDFLTFQQHLKNLSMLYKTRHQLMESLNENGLYTAKCYNEVLGGSPLTSVVAPGGGRHASTGKDNSSPADAGIQYDLIEGDADVAKNRKVEGEGSGGSAGLEPEGEGNTHMASATSLGPRAFGGRDPPSTKSVASGGSHTGTESTTSPAKSAVSMVVSRDGLNIIDDDDDDTFIDAANIASETAGEMDTPEKAGDDAASSGSDDGRAGRNEYLNISNDGELLVVTPSTELGSSPAPSPSPSALCTSYYDVHKAEYRDFAAKLEGHTLLVRYVEDWLETVSTRVQSRYYEYGKHRTSLVHYEAKVDALLAEHEKLRQKEKPLKPKQVEKMERNRVKLTGARETHDDAGEALLMLMDEVIGRSWRDTFPLLKGSIQFECDYAATTHSHMTQLGPSLEVLDGIGEKELIAVEGRLERIRTTKIMDEIFTGVTDGLFTRAP